MGCRYGEGTRQDQDDQQSYQGTESQTLLFCSGDINIVRIYFRIFLSVAYVGTDGEDQMEDHKNDKECFCVAHLPYPGPFHQIVNVKAKDDDVADQKSYGRNDTVFGISIFHFPFPGKGGKVVAVILFLLGKGEAVLFKAAQVDFALYQHDETDGKYRCGHRHEGYHHARESVHGDFVHYLRICGGHEKDKGQQENAEDHCKYCYFLLGLQIVFDGCFLHTFNL